MACGIFFFVAFVSEGICVTVFCFLFTLELITNPTFIEKKKKNGSVQMRTLPIQTVT